MNILMFPGEQISNGNIKKSKFYSSKPPYVVFHNLFFLKTLEKICFIENYYKVIEQYISQWKIFYKCMKKYSKIFDLADKVEKNGQNIPEKLQNLTKIKDNNDIYKIINKSWINLTNSLIYKQSMKIWGHTEIALCYDVHLTKNGSFFSVLDVCNSCSIFLSFNQKDDKFDCTSYVLYIEPKNGDERKENFIKTMRKSKEGQFRYQLDFKKRSEVCWNP